MRCNVDNQTSDQVGLKRKRYNGTLALVKSPEWFWIQVLILGISMPILRRSYRVIRRFKCKVSFSICDVVANLHDRPQACSAQKSNGFMVRQHTCPLCIQGVILLVPLSASFDEQKGRSQDVFKTLLAVPRWPHRKKGLKCVHGYCQILQLSWQQSSKFI